MKLNIMSRRTAGLMILQQSFFSRIMLTQVRIPESQVRITENWLSFSCLYRQKITTQQRDTTQDSQEFNVLLVCVCGPGCAVGDTHQAAQRLLRGGGWDAGCAFSYSPGYFSEQCEHKHKMWKDCPFRSCMISPGSLAFPLAEMYSFQKLIKHL